ncbi:hypothetical protein BaRGS_00032754 [Batillaria attramentaria]|uniref:Monocarboxylate transporter n=1 Tax=Batillaria attramentaria TaxID=370345 RepID=A0ABD0JLX5_9CAEN
MDAVVPSDRNDTEIAPKTEPERRRNLPRRSTETLTEEDHGDTCVDGDSTSPAVGSPTTRTAKPGHQMDRGYAWVILAAYFTLFGIDAGFLRSYGLFFVEMQERYDVSASEMSLVGSIMQVVLSITAIFVMTFVLGVLTERQSALVGITVWTVSVAFSSLATSFPVYLVTLGGLIGFGFSFMYGPGFVLLGKYFKRHLTLATAIANTGVSVGLLLVAAILSQMFVCACLLRPVGPVEAAGTPSTAKPDGKSDSGFADEESDGGKGGSFEMEETNRRSGQDTLGRNETGDASNVVAVGLEVTRHRTPDRDGQLDTIEEVPGSSSVVSAATQETRPRGVLPNVAKEMHHLRGVPLGASLPHLTTDAESEYQKKQQRAFLDKLSSSEVIAFASVPDLLPLSTSARNPTKPRSRFARATSKIRICHACPRLSAIVDVTIFQDLIFWALIFYQGLGVMAGILGPVFLPPLAKEKQLSDREATFLLTLISGLDIASRLLPGIISHYKLMEPYQMVLCSFLILGTLCQLTEYFNTFPELIGFCAVFGCLSGVFLSMSAVVAIQFLGLKRFPVAFGFMQLISGTCLGAGYPIVGSLRDRTGTYGASFKFLGATQFVAGCLLASLPYLRQRQTKRGIREVTEKPLRDEDTVTVLLNSSPADEQ